MFKEQVNEKLFEYYEEVIAEEKSFKPLYLDYRIDNTCNLGCITCSPHLSSSIEAKARAAGLVVQKKQQQMNSIKKFGDELKSIVKIHDKGFLYFANGEPFLSLYHWEVLEKIISDGKAPSFRLKYNSNLSIDKYRGRNLEDFLSKFKEVTIYPSLDSWGEIGDFLRRGLKNANWLKNFKKLKELGLIGDGKINIVLSTPAIINLPELLAFLKDLNHEYIFSPVIGFGHEVLLSPSSLDRETFENIILSFPEGFSVPKELDQIKLSTTDRSGNLKEAIEYYYLLDNQYPEAKVLDYFSQSPYLKKWFYQNLKTLYFSTESSPIRFSQSLPIEFISTIYNQEKETLYLSVHNDDDHSQPLPIHQLNQLFEHFNLKLEKPVQSPLRRLLRSWTRKGGGRKNDTEETLNFQKVIDDYVLTQEIEYLPPKVTYIFKKNNLFTLALFNVIRAITILSPSLTAFKCVIRISK